MTRNGYPETPQGRAVQDLHDWLYDAVMGKHFELAPWSGGFQLFKRPSGNFTPVADVSFDAGSPDEILVDLSGGEAKGQSYTIHHMIYVKRKLFEFVFSGMPLPPDLSEDPPGEDWVSNWWITEEEET